MNHTTIKVNEASNEILRDNSDLYENNSPISNSSTEKIFQNNKLISNENDEYKEISKEIDTYLGESKNGKKFLLTS